MQKKTEYSISAVSVLNGTNKISLDVQRRIVQVAEELNIIQQKSNPMYSNGTKDVVLISGCTR